MKRKIILILIMLVSLDLLWAQEQQVKIETIFEKEFEEEIIDVAFPSEEEIVASEKQGKFPHPRTVVFKNKIKFFDSEGNLLKEISLEKFGKPSEINPEIYPNFVTLLKSGKVLIDNRVSDYEHNLYFYDGEGNLLWTKMDIGNEPFVSGNEKYIVTGMKNFLVDGSEECVVFELSGVELFRRRFKWPWFVHSLSDDQLVIGEYSKISLFKVRGEKRWTISDFDFLKSEYKVKTGRIDSNNVILVLTRNKELFAFDENANLLWQQRKVPFTAIEIAPMQIICLLARADMMDYVYALDLKSGNRLWELNDIEDEEFDGIQVSTQSLFLLQRYGEWAPAKKKCMLLIDGKNGRVIKKIEDQNDINGMFLGDYILIKKKKALSIVKVTK